MKQALRYLPSTASSTERPGLLSAAVQPQCRIGSHSITLSLLLPMMALRHPDAMSDHLLLCHTLVTRVSHFLSQDPSLTRVEDLPLLANTTFGGALGLAPGSQAYTQSLLANTINKPIIINGTLLNQKVPNITASDGRAADGGNGTRLMATLSQPFTADTAVAWGSSWTPPDPKKPSGRHKV
jgi:hypothetical protein